MVIEFIFMKFVIYGVFRQEVYEEVCVFFYQVFDVVKQQGGCNDFFECIKKIEFFCFVWGDIDSFVDFKLFIGNCFKIVEDYCNGEVVVKLVNYKELLDKVFIVQFFIQRICLDLGFG